MRFEPEKPIYDFQTYLGKVFKLYPRFTVTKERPPHVILQGFGPEKFILGFPQNWIPFRSKFPVMHQRLFVHYYYQTHIPQPLRYGFCSGCGFNTVWESACVRCKGKEIG